MTVFHPARASRAALAYASVQWAQAYAHRRRDHVGARREAAGGAPGALEADFSSEDGTEARSEPIEDIDPLDELMRIVSEAPARPPYRIQFVGGGAESGSSVLKEVGLRASDQSEAVRKASRLR
jgi:hypothetical protein